ncbi:MAG: hypothetical protein K6F08_00590 [bacterium]|nr:hypothetical protein [bacterium]
MKLIKKASIIIVCFIVIIESLVSLNKLFLYFALIKQSSATSKVGTFVVTVLEAGSLNPIDNATVCIVETKKYYQTNNHGSTNKLSAPILNSSPLNNSLVQHWGEITLLVYKPGYADTIVFNTAIFVDKIRIGIVVFLNPIINNEDNKPTIISETPDEVWVKELIKLNKK